MSIVLITGSCGLVGSESVAFFASKGFDVVGIDNNSRLEFFGKFHWPVEIGIKLFLNPRTQHWRICANFCSD